jgi:hypothetical protein
VVRGAAAAADEDDEEEEEEEEDEDGDGDGEEYDEGDEDGAVDIVVVEEEERDRSGARPPKPAPAAGAARPERALPWESAAGGEAPGRGAGAEAVAHRPEPLSQQWVRATWIVNRKTRRDVWVWVQNESDALRAELCWAARTSALPPAAKPAPLGLLPIRCVGRIARPAPRLLVLRVAPRALRDARFAGGPEVNLEVTPGREDEAAFAALLQRVEALRSPPVSPSADSW